MAEVPVPQVRGPASLPMPMKKPAKIALTTLVVIIVSLAIVLHHLNQPYREIAALDANYLTTQRGMTHEEVIQIMGSPHRIGSGGAAYWDDERMPSEENIQITQHIEYTVKTFFLPVTFEFSFDKNKLLVARHRYD